MTKLSDFPNQHTSGGYVPDEASLAPSVPVPQPSGGSKIRKPQDVAQTTAISPNMSDAQAKAYANEGAVLLIRNRIVELNESIETVRAEGNNVQEWEALLMIIHELERIVVNIPGYTDPARGKPDMSSVK